MQVEICVSRLLEDNGTRMEDDIYILYANYMYETFMRLLLSVFYEDLTCLLDTLVEK